MSDALDIPAMQFTYVSPERQIYYSATRRALGEYVNYGRGWKFDGWLWDGQVKDRADAQAKTQSYVLGGES